MTGKALTIGVLPLARPTFDVPFAEEMLAGMLGDLKASGHRLVGPQTLLMDAAATESAMADIAGENPDRILILQVTFTDAAMACRIAERFGQTLAIWAVPEPRLGGRLRLNASAGSTSPRTRWGCADGCFPGAMRRPARRGWRRCSTRCRW